MQHDLRRGDAGDERHQRRYVAQRGRPPPGGGLHPDEDDVPGLSRGEDTAVLEKRERIEEAAGER